MKTKRRKSAAEKPAATPTRLTWKGKLQIYGSIIVVLSFIIVPHTIHVRYEKRIHAEKLERTLQLWRVSFHLDDRQVDLIRKMEMAFHGNGNSFTRPFRSIEEEQKHHQEISAIMSPEDGKRFMASLRRH